MTHFQEWEHAEIERSRAEARHTTVERLRVDEANVRRYIRPPADTPFPLEYAFHLLGDATGKRVLDLGCGNGENSVLLARRGARVVGLDVSQALLELARRRFALNGMAQRAQFVACSAHELPLPNRSVDLVFGIAILHHLDLSTVSREVRRVLRPGGRAIFQEPVRNSCVVKFARALVPYRAPDVSPYERPLTDAELRGFSGGFHPGRERAFLLPYMNVANVLPMPARLLFRLYRIDGTILRRAPFLRPWTGVRVFEVVK